MKRSNFVAVALVVLSAVAPSSMPVQAQMATQTSTDVDVRALEGKWEGWWIGGKSSPAEVVVKADGTYTSRLGAESGYGTFRVVNGVIYAQGHLSGGDAPISDRTITATLVQKNGVSMLTGNGRTEEGPFSFTLTKE